MNPIMNIPKSLLARIMEIDAMATIIGEIIREAGRIREETACPRDGGIGRAPWCCETIVSSAADNGVVVPRDEKNGTGVLRNGLQDVAERLTDRHRPFGCEIQDGDDGIVRPIVIEGHGSACTIRHGEIAPGEISEAGAH